MSLPKIVITRGDPKGIGPEVIARSLPRISKFCEPLLVGEKTVILPEVEKYAEGFGKKLGRDIPLLSPETLGGKTPEEPAPAGDRGSAQVESVRLAVELAARGLAEGIVTGPIAKESLGPTFSGHTEMLASLTQTHPPVMLFVSKSLRVVPLTTHVPLADVPRLMTRELLEVQLHILERDLRRFFGLEAPRVALCGLNPHAGEDGRFGREEIDIFQPAVAALRDYGIDIHGPFPADTVFRRAVEGEFDLVVAPTHDQALIPIKLLHFEDAVNVTLGLPVIRTSPAHGTALDIAGKGVASPSGMIAAVRTAVEMVNHSQKAEA